MKGKAREVQARFKANHNHNLPPPPHITTLPTHPSSSTSSVSISSSSWEIRRCSLPSARVMNTMERRRRRMRKPTTPSTMLITKVGVSASLDKEDVNTLSKNIVISTYMCCINFNLVRLKYSPVKLLSGVKTMVTSHVMLPQARCCYWGGRCHFVYLVLFPFCRKIRSMKVSLFQKN